MIKFFDMTLQQKIMNAFLGKVVRKDLSFLVKGGLPVPTYVLVYLLYSGFKRHRQAHAIP